MPSSWKGSEPPSLGVCKEDPRVIGDSPVQQMIRSFHSSYRAPGAAAGLAGNQGLRAGDMETLQRSLVTPVKGGSAGTPWCAHEAEEGVVWVWCQGRWLRGGGTSRPRQRRTWLHEGEERASGAVGPACARALRWGAEGQAGAQRMRWHCGVGGARRHRASRVSQCWGAAEGFLLGTGRMH